MRRPTLVSFLVPILLVGLAASCKDRSNWPLQLTDPSASAQIVSNMVAQLKEGMSKEDVITALGRPLVEWPAAEGGLKMVYVLDLGTNTVRYVPSGVQVVLQHGKVIRWDIIHSNVGSPAP